MVKRSQHLGLAPEARQAFRVRSEHRRENFQGYVASKLGIACAVYLAHSAGPNGHEDLIRSQTSTTGDGHAGLILTHEITKRNGRFGKVRKAQEIDGNHVPFSDATEIDLQ